MLETLLKLLLLFYLGSVDELWLEQQRSWFYFLSSSSFMGRKENRKKIKEHNGVKYDDG